MLDTFIGIVLIAIMSACLYCAYKIFLSKLDNPSKAYLGIFIFGTLIGISISLGYLNIHTVFIAIAWIFGIAGVIGFIFSIGVWYESYNWDKKGRKDCKIIRFEYD